MKKLLIGAALLTVSLFILAPVAIADSTEQAFNKCKSEAEAEEVADADIKIYVANCMKELGAEGEQAKALINEEYSVESEETAKASMSE
ncbi:hypothetical protein [Kaarinaea lacus]